MEDSNVAQKLPENPWTHALLECHKHPNVLVNALETILICLGECGRDHDYQSEPSGDH